MVGSAALFLRDRDDYDAFVRFQRTALLATRMLASYSWQLHVVVHPSDLARAEALRGCHRRHAPELRALCFKNGGIYIKVGQLLGLMDHILPLEYVEALSGCFEACPRSSAEDVNMVFLEEIGKTPLEVFESFDEQPFASASLAQVHRATLPGGKAVAVKVQHRPLLKTTRSEIAGIDYLLRVIRSVEPAFGFEWLAEEVKESLPKELDFRLEAQNCARCRIILNRAGLENAVVVPNTHPNLTTQRLLVMDFEEGLSFAATARDLQSHGVRPHAVVRRFAEAYAAMTFNEGFLHCDPHPGNVLWRRVEEAPDGFQLVLLDHGLYRELPMELRLSYCRLWRGIALADGDGVLQATRELGVRSEWLVQKIDEEGRDGLGRIASATASEGSCGDAETLAGKMLAAMLTARSFRAVADASGGLMRFDKDYRGKNSADEQEVARYIAGYYRGILEVLDTLPRAMILVLKANDCLRAIASKFGVPPSVPLAVSCLACCKALREVGDRSWRLWLFEWRCRLFLALEGAVSSRWRGLRRALAGA